MLRPGGLSDIEMRLLALGLDQFHLNRMLEPHVPAREGGQRHRQDDGMSMTSISVAFADQATLPSRICSVFRSE